ncbi:MAG: hypothetical protein ACETVN_04085 [Asgard group archaeon]
MNSSNIGIKTFGEKQEKKKLIRRTIFPAPDNHYALFRDPEPIPIHRLEDGTIIRLREPQNFKEKIVAYADEEYNHYGQTSTEYTHTWEPLVERFDKVLQKTVWLRARKLKGFIKIVRDPTMPKIEKKSKEKPLKKTKPKKEKKGQTPDPEKLDAWNPHPTTIDELRTLIEERKRRNEENRKKGIITMRSPPSDTPPHDSPCEFCGSYDCCQHCEHEENTREGMGEEGSFLES